jgi:hypothetical protein
MAAYRARRAGAGRRAAAAPLEAPGTLDGKGEAAVTQIALPVTRIRDERDLALLTARSEAFWTGLRDIDRRHPRGPYRRANGELAIAPAGVDAVEDQEVSVEPVSAFEPPHEGGELGGVKRAVLGERLNGAVTAGDAARDGHNANDRAGGGERNAVGATR